jgi:hypothetical protein
VIGVLYLHVMTRDQAQAECMRLATEHPDRATHSWLARETAPGEWSVAKVGIPSRGPLTTTQEAKPRPPQGDDPRPPMWRDVGGPYAGS